MHSQQTVKAVLSSVVCMWSLTTRMQGADATALLLLESATQHTGWFNTTVPLLPTESATRKAKKKKGNTETVYTATSTRCCNNLWFCGPSSRCTSSLPHIARHTRRRVHRPMVPRWQSRSMPCHFSRTLNRSWAWQFNMHFDMFHA